MKLPLAIQKKNVVRPRAFVTEGEVCMHTPTTIGRGEGLMGGASGRQGDAVG